MKLKRFFESPHSLLRMALIFGCLGSGGTGFVQAEQFWVYVGTYTGAKSKGVYAALFETRDGSFRPAQLAAAAQDPSFLAAHLSGKFLYAVNEVSEFQGGSGGGLSAFRVDPASGKLTPMNSQPSKGAAPCHVMVDRAGKTAFLANYSGGSVASYPIHSDGSLGGPVSFQQHAGKGPDAQRQNGPHAHSIYLDHDNRFALAADLGLDQILVYRYDSGKSSLVANDPPFVRLKPGAGPRHLAFHPQGKLLYSINEMNSTITAFHYDGAKGELHDFQTVSTLPTGFTGQSSTAEIFVHPSGHFLFGSNRGHDSIVVFTVDPSSGSLTLLQHQPIGGKTPRGFRIDPSGRWLLVGNQESDQITVFQIDRGTGRLTPVGKPLEVPSPVSLEFVKAR